MARVYGIEKQLTQNKVDEKQIKEIIGNKDLIDIVNRMDELLDPDMTHQILGACGCTGGRAYLKQCEKIGKEIADKTLEEKLKHLNEDPEAYQMILNEDNTLRVKMFFKDNDKYRCVCSASVKKGVRVSDLAQQEKNSDQRVMPLSYCFCCAGSNLIHSQLKLGIQLRTKEIVSSPIHSKGNKPCEFIFEMI